MIKKFLFFLPLLTLLFFGCKKQDTPNATFTLTANLRSSNAALLNWTSSNLTGFKNVSIYRSTSPIPDPTFDKPIDGNLQIALLVDNTLTSFVDSNITVGSNGTVYYKVVLNLSDRFITSNQAQVSLNAFSVNLPNNSGFVSNSLIYKRIPELNMLYVFDFNQGIISAIDYTQKKIIATTNFSLSNVNANYMYACINNNNPELFVYSNSLVTCYNGLTLAQKYSLNVYSSMYDFKVKNGFLYELISNGNWYINTYNLSSLSLVNQTALPYGALINTNNSNNNVNSSLFVSNQSNNLYLKYYTNFYSNINFNYNYTNKLIAYDITSGVLGSITNLNIAAINIDTTNSNNEYYNTYIQISPDAKYVACNKNGDIYTMSDNSIHNISSSGNPVPTAIFSNDGRYMLSQMLVSSGTGQISDNVNVYGLPGVSLTTSLISQSASGFLFDDFMDNDTLISYHISQLFVNSQTTNVLTVQFKKVD